jgi:hypothetical protein
LANPLFAAPYGVILKTVPKPAPSFEVAIEISGCFQDQRYERDCIRVGRVKAVKHLLDTRLC